MKDTTITEFEVSDEDVMKITKDIICAKCVLTRCPEMHVSYTPTLQLSEPNLICSDNNNVISEVLNLLKNGVINVIN